MEKESWLLMIELTTMSSTADRPHTDIVSPVSVIVTPQPTTQEVHHDSTPAQPARPARPGNQPLLEWRHKMQCMRWHALQRW